MADTRAEIQTIHGCTGAAIQAGGRTKVVWIQGTSANGISFELISPDYSIEEMLKIAESDQKK